MQDPRRGGDAAVKLPGRSYDDRSVWQRSLSGGLKKSESGAYRAARVGRKPATIAGERRLWNFRLKEELGRKRVDDLTRDEVREFWSG